MIAVMLKSVGSIKNMCLLLKWSATQIIIVAMYFVPITGQATVLGALHILLLILKMTLEGRSYKC